LNAITYTSLCANLAKTIDSIITDHVPFLVTFKGKGNPEPLKYNWSGFWSLRINRERRLVYTI
jgi:Txe/YoeB family toxin of toxin-antitoxin system